VHPPQRILFDFHCADEGKQKSLSRLFRVILVAITKGLVSDSSWVADIGAVLTP
jgi:hypothetical protein